MIKGLGDFEGLLERSASGGSLAAFLGGKESAEAEVGNGGGGGGPVVGRGGGGGGLRLPLKDELVWISMSGDGGGGNSGEVEQSGRELREGS